MYSLVLMVALSDGAVAPVWHHAGGCCGPAPVHYFGHRRLGFCVHPCAEPSGPVCKGHGPGFYPPHPICWGHQPPAAGSLGPVCAGHRPPLSWSPGVSPYSGMWDMSGYSTSGWGCQGGCYGAWSPWGSGDPDYTARAINGPSPYEGFYSDDATAMPQPALAGAGEPARESRAEVAGLSPAGAAEEAVAPAPATIVVRLPADARLTVDDSPTTSTSARRTFETPALDPGRRYYYTLAATVMRDGRPHTVRKRVAVQAGRETLVSLELPAGFAGR